MIKDHMYQEHEPVARFLIKDKDPDGNPYDFSEFFGDTLFNADCRIVDAIDALLGFQVPIMPRLAAIFGPCDKNTKISNPDRLLRFQRLEQQDD